MLVITQGYLGNLVITQGYGKGIPTAAPKVFFVLNWQGQAFKAEWQGRQVSANWQGQAFRDNWQGNQVSANWTGQTFKAEWIS